nr:hypothetical protein Iba_chr03cCG7780 [Ipomoea batatas]
MIIDGATVVKFFPGGVSDAVQKLSESHGDAMPRPPEITAAKEYSSGLHRDLRKNWTKTLTAFSPSPFSAYLAIIEFHDTKSGFLIFSNTSNAVTVSPQHRWGQRKLAAVGIEKLRSVSYEQALEQITEPEND